MYVRACVGEFHALGNHGHDDVAYEQPISGKYSAYSSAGHTESATCFSIKDSFKGSTVLLTGCAAFCIIELSLV